MAWWAPIAAVAASKLIGGNDPISSVDNPYANIALPDTEKMKLLLEQYGSAGNLTPEALQALQISQQDQLQDVTTDPRLKKAQMDALDFMQKTGSGELTPAERAQVNDLRRTTEADNTARLQAMLQQQDARGVGSSDMALAARMLEAQGSANRQAASTDDIAAAAFQRALQSVAQSANLAGNMEQSEYARQAQLAQALRERELANLQNQQNISNQNVNARNAAQQFNLQNQQNIMNQNTQLRNQQQQYNKQLEQQNFENQIKKAGGTAGINQTNANLGNYARGINSEATGNIIGGIAKGIGSYFTKPEDKKG